MPPTSPSRGPLNRGTVLREAIALADADGLEALSMRRLAERLGVVPMALYKHLADKEDLLDGIVEVLLSDLPRPHAERRGSWRASFVQTIDGVRELHRSHPWLRRVLETRTLRTPAVLAHMEHLTSLLLAGGFTADLTHHVMHMFGNRIWGYSPELFNEAAPASAAPRRSTAASPDPADYPGILAVVADARARRPAAVGCDEDVEFTFALDVLLDAAERLRRSGWSSPSGEGGHGSATR